MWKLPKKEKEDSFNILTGIDIGSLFLRATIIVTTDNTKHILHSEVESSGVRNGVIIEEKLLANSLIKLKQKIKEDYGINITHSAVGISGITVCSGYTFGSHMVSRGDGVVGETDVNLAIQKAESAYGKHNMYILESIPIKFRLDNKTTTPPIIGLHANKIEIKLMSIACDQQIYNKLLAAMKIAKIDISTVVSSSFSEAERVLNKKDKSQGSVLINMSSSFTSIIIYNNWEPVYVTNVTYGIENIVKAIALNLKLKLDDAELILRANNRESFSKRKLDETLTSESSKLASLINGELEKINLREMLPSGAILIAKTQNINTFNAILRDKLGLPLRQIDNHNIKIDDIKLQDSLNIRSYSIATRDFDVAYDEAVTDLWGQAINHIKTMISQFLP